MDTNHESGTNELSVKLFWELIRTQPVEMCLGQTTQYRGLGPRPTFNESTSKFYT